MTWSIWMLMPEPAGGGWSRVAAGLTKDEADRLVVAMLFPARAMPDETPED